MSALLALLGRVGQLEFRSVDWGEADLNARGGWHAADAIPNVQADFCFPTAAALNQGSHL
jgi:hypothetical protein